MKHRRVGRGKVEKAACEMLGTSVGRTIVVRHSSFGCGPSATGNSTPTSPHHKLLSSDQGLCKQPGNSSPTHNRSSLEHSLLLFFRMAASPSLQCSPLEQVMIIDLSNLYLIIAMMERRRIPSASVTLQMGATTRQRLHGGLFSSSPRKPTYRYSSLQSQYR